MLARTSTPKIPTRSFATRILPMPLVQRQEGNPACKKLDVGLSVVMIWLELCMTYSSSSPVVTTTSTISINTGLARFTWKMTIMWPKWENVHKPQLPTQATCVRTIQNRKTSVFAYGHLINPSLSKIICKINITLCWPIFQCRFCFLSKKGSG